MGDERFRSVKADVAEYVRVTGPVDCVLHFELPASPLDDLQLPIETMEVGAIGTLHALGLLTVRRTDLGGPVNPGSPHSFALDAAFGGLNL